MYSQSDTSSTPAGRVIDLETGEITSGDLDTLLKLVCAAPALRQRTDERFSEAGGTQSASGAQGLYSLPYRADTRKTVSVTVYADIMHAQKIGGSVRDDEESVNLRAEVARRRRLRDPAKKRGVVVGFGSRPRKRMIEALAKIRNVNGGHFLTLTLSDAVWVGFSPDDQSGMASLLKDKLHALEKRLIARFPAVGGIWRMEFKARKSGGLLGVVVPHLHILAFGIVGAGLDLLRAWLSDAWYEVVGSGDVKHFEAGTNCRELSSRRHAAAYVSKYVGKAEADDFEAGRRWGTFGQLDQSGSLTVDLTLDEWVQFKRLARGWLKSRRSRFAAVLARVPATFGASLLGLGDESIRGSPDPTVLKMLSAVGVQLKG